MKYLDELKKLNLPTEKYLVIGSGPLAIRGLRENSDIDILVNDELWKELAEKYPMETRGEIGKCISLGHLEIWQDFEHMTDIDRAISQSEVIDGASFANLSQCLDYKKAMGREKDKKDIGLINEYLKSKGGDNL